MKTMKTLIPIIIVFSLVISSLIFIRVNARKESERIEKFIQIACEQAYFKGQLDAINNNIRIKQINDSSFVWIRSCWNNNKKPIFQPNSTMLKSFNIKIK